MKSRQETDKILQPLDDPPPFPPHSMLEPLLKKQSPKSGLFELVFFLTGKNPTTSATLNAGGRGGRSGKIYCASLLLVAIFRPLPVPRALCWGMHERHTRTQTHTHTWARPKTRKQTRTHGHTDTWTRGHTDTQTHGHTDRRTRGHTDTQTHRNVQHRALLA